MMKKESVINSYKETLNCCFDYDEEPKDKFIKEIFDSQIFVKKVFSFVTDYYADRPDIIDDEYIITSYYGAICATIMWLQGDKKFNSLTAWDHLEESFDVEFTDVEAERLMGITDNDEAIESVWDICQEYFYTIEALVCEDDNDTVAEEMEGAYKLGMLEAVRWFETGVLSSIPDGQAEYMKLEDICDSKTPFIGKTVSVDWLNACNFHYYSEYADDTEKQINSLPYGVFLPEECWIKHYRIGGNVNVVLALVLDENWVVKDIICIYDIIEHSAISLLLQDGENLLSQHLYVKQDEIPFEIYDDLEVFFPRHAFAPNYSLIGKSLPELFDTVKQDNKNVFVYDFHSPYRKAILNAKFIVDDNNIIEDIELTTYQTVENAEMDMMSGPAILNENENEVRDLILTILGAYTDEEYNENVPHCNDMKWRATVVASKKSEDTFVHHYDFDIPNSLYETAMWYADNGKDIESCVQEQIERLAKNNLDVELLFDNASDRAGKNNESISYDLFVHNPGRYRELVSIYSGGFKISEEFGTEDDIDYVEICEKHRIYLETGEYDTDIRISLKINGLGEIVDIAEPDMRILIYASHTHVRYERIEPDYDIIEEIIDNYIDEYESQEQDLLNF